jgi:hypothetical protein
MAGRARAGSAGPSKNSAVPGSDRTVPPCCDRLPASAEIFHATFDLGDDQPFALAFLKRFPVVRSRLKFQQCTRAFLEGCVEIS